MSNKPKTRRKTAQKNSAKPRSTTQRRGDGWKWFLIVLAIAVLAVAITAGITNGFKDWNPYGWFDKKIKRNRGTKRRNRACTNMRTGFTCV